MPLCFITVLLLVTVAYRDVRSSLCDSTNCSAAKLRNFSCEEGYEKEVELFKNRHGGLEQYDYPADIYPSKPYVRVSYIRLNEYWNSSKILEYNKEYKTNVTHGLEIGFTVEGNRGNTSLFMKFSSTNKFNNAKDHFYEAHPEKRVFDFSSSQTVITHLCLQGLQTRPVSYTVLLTVFPEWESTIHHWRPTSTNHYMSFSKDNLAVAVSNFPSKTDIRVVYDTPSDQDMCTCVRMLYLCKDSGGCVNNSTKQCQDVNNFRNNYVSTSHVWSNRSPGIYYVKIEFSCVSMRNGERRVRGFYLNSSLIEIPESFRKENSKYAIDGKVLVNTDREYKETTTTPFVVIGSLIAIVLLIVMYIAVGKKVPSVFCFLNRKKQRKSESECIQSFPIVSGRPISGVSFEPIDIIPRIDEEAVSRASSESGYTDQERWDADPDQIQETIEYDDISVRRQMMIINMDGCPVHGQ